MKSAVDRGLARLALSRPQRVALFAGAVALACGLLLPAPGLWLVWVEVVIAGLVAGAAAVQRREIGTRWPWAAMAVAVSLSVSFAGFVEGMSVVAPWLAGSLLLLPVLGATAERPAVRWSWWLAGCAVTCAVVWRTIHPAVGVGFSVVGVAFAALLHQSGAPGELRANAALLRRTLARRVGVSAERTTTSDDLTEAATRQLGESLHQQVRLVRAALRGQTAVILWLDDRRAQARIVAVDSSVASGSLHAGPFPDTSGWFRLLRREARVHRVIAHTSSALAVPWYGPDSAPVHAIGRVVSDEGIPVAYLCADRDGLRTPFDEADEVVVDAAAREVGRLVHAERLLLEAARSRREMELLYRAADALNRALTEAEVHGIAEQLFAELVPGSSLLVVRADEQGVLAAGYGTPDLMRLCADRTIDPVDSLVGLAIQRRHALPYGSTPESTDPPALGAGVPSPRSGSVHVVPLFVSLEPLGALVLWSPDEQRFTPALREQIRLIANYVAAALGNAMAYGRMARQASTDGMTGLTNQRTFRERGREAVARALRQGRVATLILTDIDHFKQVNDTWGHAVGDEVIRSVADQIRHSTREVDLAARYGGEEFAILLEDTGPDEAAALAERLRERVRAVVHQAGEQVFSVSLSLGIATLPDDARTLEDLIVRADEALYAAKRGGRDQVRRYGRHEVHGPGDDGLRLAAPADQPDGGADPDAGIG